jgi:transcription antitermination factor NusG
LDGWQFYESRNIRHLYQTKLQLYPAEVSQLLDRKAELDAENARVEAEIEAGRRVVDYKPGDALMIERGPFADRMSSFASVVSRARGWGLRVYIDGMDVPVHVSAVDVRAAE